MVGLALFSTAFRPGTCRGDGGTLRAWGQQGRYDIAVFTEPSPLVTGPVDISVLLLDRCTGEPVADARIAVDFFPAGRPDLATRHPATKQAAVNKVFHAALFELRHAGPCSVIVGIDGPDDHARIQFETDVGNPRSSPVGVWPWILGPFPIIVCYIIHRRLVDARTSKGR
jgi:hypothetical protein